MKIGRFLVAAVLAVGITGFAFAEDKATDKKAEKHYTAGSCCDKAAKAGKTCEHPCCVKAEKDGKVCEKCNPPKKESKK